LKTGAFALTRDLFLQVDDEKTQKKRHTCDQLQLLAAILAQWRRPEASTKALDFLHWAMCMVLYRCTTVASKLGAFFFCCFIYGCPGSRWGNTEHVVAQW
jgi:hypothetical protein